MKIQFWGVRGSIPSPLTPLQIQAKIAAVIQRISVKDIESEDAREKFIASLPKWIYGTIGGNTPCVELTLAGGNKIILDAGTGMRMLGKLGIPPVDHHYHIFLSHFHWDHIQGLPFFEPAFRQDSIIDFYSPYPDMEKYLADQMRTPYYPVPMSTMTKNIKCNVIKAGKPMDFMNLTVNSFKMTHPGDSYAYSFIEDGKKFVYATDVELSPKDFERTGDRADFFDNTDVLILDSQYTVEEAYQKQNWGHSAFCYAIDFAVAWHVKRLYLYHYEPSYDDKKINSILQAARWYADYIAHGGVQVYLAIEGLEVEL